jgi:hypothetical protein
MACSKAQLKNNGDKASPCFKPFLIGNMSNSCLPGFYYRFHSDTFSLALPVSRPPFPLKIVIELNN